MSYSSAKFGLPDASDGGDHRNKVMKLIAIVAALVLLPAVVFMQQYLIELSSRSYSSPTPEVEASEEVSAPAVAPLTTRSKELVLAAHWVSTHKLDGEMEAEWKKARDEMFDELKPLAASRSDRLRLAVVTAEMRGKDAGLEKLDALAKEVEAGGPLSRDVEWLRILYREGDAKVPAEAREALVDRHGWFGHLAISFGKPTGDIHREDTVGGYQILEERQSAVGVFMFCGLVAGVIALLVIWNSFRQEVFEADAESIGGPVYLEAFAIFLLGFLVLLCLTVLTAWVTGPGSLASMGVKELLQWALIGAAFWPLVRGVSWEDFKIDMGLHSGAGFGREVVVGIVAYLASMIIQFFLNILIGIIERMVEVGSGAKPKGDPTGFPLFENPLGHTWPAVWIGIAGAVMWAPICEELMIRGALFRWVRPWAKAPGTIIITGIVFGVLHPYGWQGILQVGVMGIFFGFLREWRGSLIAPMVMHALHNGLLSMIQVLVLDVLGDK